MHVDLRCPPMTPVLKLCVLGKQLDHEEVGIVRGFLDMGDVL